MLPLGLNLHFSRVHFATLVADAVQAAPKNRVTQAYWQAQKSQNLAGTSWDTDFEVVPKQGPFGQLSGGGVINKNVLKFWQKSLISGREY